MSAIAVDRHPRRAATTDARTPPGWSANPSSWGQRLPIVGLALVGFPIAGYLALYQWGVVATVWDVLRRRRGA